MPWYQFNCQQEVNGKYHTVRCSAYYEKTDMPDGSVSFFLKHGSLRILKTYPNPKNNVLEFYSIWGEISTLKLIGGDI